MGASRGVLTICLLLTLFFLAKLTTPPEVDVTRRQRNLALPFLPALWCEILQAIRMQCK